MGTTPAGDDGGADEWDAAALDEAFVSSAPIIEKTAEERIEERRRAEEARRIFDELAADQELAEILSRRRRRRRIRHAFVGLLVVVAMFLGAVATRCTLADEVADELALDGGVGLGSWTATEVPPPAFDRQPQPIGQPPDVDDAGAYDFVALQPDGETPVAYDPCRPIHYVVNTANQPTNGERLLKQALAEIERATGFEFINDGPTSEEPTRDRAAYQPNRYGRIWAPVLIAWTDEDDEPGLAGAVVGSAGSIQVSVTGAPSTAASVFVTGSVNLDGDDLGALRRRDDGDARVQAIIQHELAHLVGLDHVDDPDELMYPTAGSRTEFGRGDRAGLAKLGSGACFPSL